MLNEFHVKNYEEYIRRLKQTFADIEKMPSNMEMESFISEYNLDLDWKIVTGDVRKDIISEILNAKSKNHLSGRKKRISSYKEYLFVLKAKFGIPQKMPDKSEIECFISEYDLEGDWGITVKDIFKDFENIIDGKYDEMYKDAIQDAKETAHKIAPKTYTSTGIIRSTVHIYPILKPTVVSPIKEQKTIQNKKTSVQSCQNKKGNKGKKSKDKWNSVILVDGDNHINEAVRGIEHTTKNTSVRAIFSQPGAKRKFDEKYGKLSNVSSRLVLPGNQAVDNQIKAEAGQLLKKEKHKITIVSRDKGFADFANKKKDKKSKNKISTAKSVQEAMKKNKKIHP